MLTHLSKMLYIALTQEYHWRCYQKMLWLYSSIQVCLGVGCVFSAYAVLLYVGQILCLSVACWLQCLTRKVSQGQQARKAGLVS